MRIIGKFLFKGIANLLDQMKLEFPILKEINCPKQLTTFAVTSFYFV